MRVDDPLHLVVWILKVLSITSTEGFALAGLGQGYQRPVAMNDVL